MVAKRVPRPKRRKMPGPVRIGIALIILGAILVGFGTLYGREAMSIYGFIVVVCGFFLYFISYYYLGRIQKRNTRKPR
jgi:membrane-bound ClpP family serine protease